MKVFEQIRALRLHTLPDPAEEDRKQLAKEINTPNHHGLYPLHIAVALLDYNLVEGLIHYGGDPFVRDADGYCPLHALNDATTASDIEHADNIKALLLEKANINLLTLNKPEKVENIELSELFEKVRNLSLIDPSFSPRSPRAQTIRIPKLTRNKSQDNLSRSRILSPRTTTLTNMPNSARVEKPDVKKVTSFERLEYQKTLSASDNDKIIIKMESAPVLQHHPNGPASINQLIDAFIKKEKSNFIYLLLDANIQKIIQSEVNLLEFIEPNSQHGAMEFLKSCLINLYHTNMPLISNRSKAIYLLNNELNDLFLRAGLHRDYDAQNFNHIVTETYQDDPDNIDKFLRNMLSLTLDNTLGKHSLNEMGTQCYTAGILFLNEEKNIFAFLQNNWAALSADQQLIALYVLKSIMLLDSHTHCMPHKSDSHAHFEQLLNTIKQNTNYKSYDKIIKKLQFLLPETVKQHPERDIAIQFVKNCIAHIQDGLVNVESFLRLKSSSNEIDDITKLIINDLNLMSYSFYRDYSPISESSRSRKAQEKYQQQLDKLTDAIVDAINNLVTNAQKARLMDQIILLIIQLIDEPIPNYDQALNLYGIINNDKIVNQENIRKLPPIHARIKNKAELARIESLFDPTGRFGNIKEKHKTELCIPSFTVIQQELIMANEIPNRFQKAARIGKQHYCLVKLKFAIAEMVFVPFYQTDLLFTPMPKAQPLEVKENNEKKPAPAMSMLEFLESTPAPSQAPDPVQTESILDTSETSIDLKKDQKKRKSSSKIKIFSSLTNKAKSTPKPKPDKEPEPHEKQDRRRRAFSMSFGKK